VEKGHTETVKELKIKIIIPTLNAGDNLKVLLESIKKQKNIIYEVLVMDSESTDNTIKIAKEYRCNIKRIKRYEFNHGTTRQLGVGTCSDEEFVVFMTQDTILAYEDSIRNLLMCFENKALGCVYGRQLPHKNAGFFAMYARLFNYPAKSYIRKLADSKSFGIKTAFMSDSFAAYRLTALKEVNGFPEVIVGEDMYVAAKMLLKDWQVAYCAEAMVYHSHEYTLKEEFNRYKAVGQFHASEPWIREYFGKTEGEGKKFVLSEMKYIFKCKKFSLIPMAFLRNCFKYIGYKLGRLNQ
jgi:rhamnosyltransferase